MYNVSCLRSLRPHSLLEEEDDCRHAVVEAAEQLVDFVSVPGILGDVTVLFHPLPQVLQLKKVSTFIQSAWYYHNHVIIGATSGPMTPIIAIDHVDSVADRDRHLSVNQPI